MAQAGGALNDALGAEQQKPKRPKIKDLAQNSRHRSSAHCGSLASKIIILGGTSLFPMICMSTRTSQLKRLQCRNRSDEREVVWATHLGGSARSVDNEEYARWG